MTLGSEIGGRATMRRGRESLADLRATRLFGFLGFSPTGHAIEFGPPAG